MDTDNSLAVQQTSIKQMDYTSKPFNVNYNSNTESHDNLAGNLSSEIDCTLEDSDEVKCIFLCKFHATAGPQIAAQVPKNYFSKDLFDTFSRYIIPKVQLQRSYLSV